MGQPKRVSRCRRRVSRHLTQDKCEATESHVDTQVEAAPVETAPAEAAPAEAAPAEAAPAEAAPTEVVPVESEPWSEAEPWSESEPWLEHCVEPGADAHAVVTIKAAVFTESLTAVLRAAGVPEAAIYAMHKTGLIILDKNEHTFTDREIGCWNTAVEEYNTSVN